MTITPDTPLTQFPGVGEVRAKKLSHLGLNTAGDLLTYYPRDYEDRRQVYAIRQAPEGVRVCVRAMVAQRPRLSRVRKGLDLVQVPVVDQGGTLHLTFFNQSYVERALLPGEDYVFYGQVERQGNRLSMTNPVFERADRQDVTGRIVPVYPLTAGISGHLLAGLVRQALPCARGLADTLPQSIRQAHHLAAAEFALTAIHFPPDDRALDLARRRLAFEELFYLAVGLAFLKRRRTTLSTGCPIPALPVEQFAALLPFSPTDAQRRTMEEAARDMACGRPMNRLVQGDVGSGKTVVATYAGWLAVQGGFQAAMMAPTEVLAEQHFRTLSALLSPAGVRVGLLTGTMTAAQKRKIHADLAAGDIDFVVGTHALLSQGVAFRRLALIITDEQHRFGVEQRSALAEKSAAGGMPSPHVLVMSATPIPRTLALILYGDLDVSVIDQLPPGRTPISTYVIREDKRQRMYQFVRRQVGEGRQVYIVCPAVEEDPEAALPGEESPALTLKAVKSYAQRLQREVFPDLTVDILHGKMRPKEKDAAMRAFSQGKTQVLVATTVIEVGVDVPNATLMIIENADRFGLSQLHQLRGRVGRGEHPSFCVLLTATRNPDSMARLRTLASTTDGFQISREDLKLRGPGDFFGRRQHGLPQMKLSDLAADMPLLHEAQAAAEELLSHDPELKKPENRPVLARVRRLFDDTGNRLN